MTQNHVECQGKTTKEFEHEEEQIAGQNEDTKPAELTGVTEKFQVNGKEGIAKLNEVAEKVQVNGKEGIAELTGVNVAEKFQENEKEAVTVKEGIAKLTSVAEKFQANEKEWFTELNEDTMPAELTGVTEKFQVLREGGHRKAQ